MSLDYTIDYASHNLLDNKAKYSKIYKLAGVEPSEVVLGDLLLLKSPCGRFNLFMATAVAEEDNTLHLVPYAERSFIKADTSDDTGLVISATDPCSC